MKYYEVIIDKQSKPAGGRQTPDRDWSTTEFRIPRKKVLYVATTRERAEEVQEKFGVSPAIRVQQYKLTEIK